MGGTICRSREETQISKSLLWLPYWFVDKFLNSTRAAEEILGQPPTSMQIFVQLTNDHGEVVKDVYQVSAVLFSLLREDILYSDAHSYKYTTEKKEGYYSYTELFQMKHKGGYTCDQLGRVVGAGARTINLNTLRNILISTDESLSQQNEWIWDGEFRFLDGAPIEKRVGFTSYPRSGNSFLRRYLEQLTGVTSGSVIHMHSATSLQIMGLKGEGHSTDDNCWIVKSHHPFDIKLSEQNTVSKTFICVRHPLDVFPSYAALTQTMSHGNKTDYDLAIEYPEWWAWFVKKRADQMKKFFEILIRHCNVDKRQPLYIVRYEDLVMAPKDTLMGLMSFLLEKKDLAGSNMERRIDAVIAKGSSAATTYKLKESSGKFDTHKAKYNAELRQYVQDTLGDQLYYFGYANVEGNPTGFFEFDQHTPENLAKHEQFRTDSAAALDSICDPNHVQTYYTHQKEEVFPIFDEEDLQRLLEPAFDHAGKKLKEAADAKGEAKT